MSKNKMKINYKTPQRKRNKNKIETDSKDEMKKNILNAFFIVLFIVLVYLGLLGLESTGLFDPGYTKPENNVQISDTNILIGEVFNRNETEYLVLFDKLDKNGNAYIRSLLSNEKDTKVYYVDMNDGFNKKYISEESNANATNSNELKINDITLIKIQNGSIKNYIVGEENIEEYLK